MTEIKFDVLQCYLFEIEFLRTLGFETIGKAIDYFGKDKVFNIQDDMFDFDYYDLTGTIGYNEESELYTITGTIDCYYPDIAEPILTIEV